MTTRRKKILVARIGAFGDVCMLLPVVRALARHHEVHWLVRDAYVPVVRAFPDVGCRLVGVAPGADPRRPFPEELVAALAGERYDCLLDCSHWACVSWLARRLDGVPVRAVTHDPAQDALLGLDRGPDPEAAFTHVVPVSPGVHQVEKWRRLIRAACGVDVEPGWPLPERSPIACGGPLRVFLHPHAGKPEKIWPVGRFARVLAAAARERPIRCVVNGVRRRLVRQLRMRLLLSRVRLAVSAFDPSFAGLREALAGCDVAVGCDSGPMHFAALLGVPTLVLYGRYSAAEFGPPWRSTAVEPPPGRDVHAIGTDRVAAEFAGLVARLSRPAGLGRRAA